MKNDKNIKTQFVTKTTKHIFPIELQKYISRQNRKLCFPIKTCFLAKIGKHVFPPKTQKRVSRQNCKNAFSRQNKKKTSFPAKNAKHVFSPDLQRCIFPSKLPKCVFPPNHGIRAGPHTDPLIWLGQRSDQPIK